MEEIIEVLREVEKARSAVEELRALNAIVSDQSQSQETRMHAQQNWNAICSNLEKQVQSNAEKLESGRYAGKEKMDSLNKVVTLGDVFGAKNATVAEELRTAVRENSTSSRLTVSGSVTNSQGQALANTNAAQVLLFGNNTYSGTTTVKIGTPNLNSAGTLAGTQVNNAQAGQQALSVTGVPGNNVKGWINNNSTSSAGITLAPAQKLGDLTQNFYLNDNVVLQQVKGKKQAAEPAKTAPGKPDTGGKVLAVDEFIFDRDDSKMKLKTQEMKEAPKPGAESEGRKKQEEVMDAEQTRGLNIARGNRQQQLEQAQLAVSNVNAPDQPAAPSQPLPAARPMPAPGVQPPMPQVTLAPLATAVPGLPYAPGARSPFRGPIPEAAKSSVTLPNEPAVQPSYRGLPNIMAALPGNVPVAAAAPTGNELQLGYLQPLGRLSLAVDFPTEGHVYHFQKVKANAVLELKFSDPKIMQRWVRIGIFAAIAIVLWLLGRLLRKRRAT